MEGQESKSFQRMILLCFVKQVGIEVERIGSISASRGVFGHRLLVWLYLNPHILEYMFYYKRLYISCIVKALLDVLGVLCVGR